jgi:hypothetical protein
MIIPCVSEDKKTTDSCLKFKSPFIEKKIKIIKLILIKIISTFITSHVKGEVKRSDFTDCSGTIRIS